MRRKGAATGHPGEPWRWWGDERTQALRRARKVAGLGAAVFTTEQAQQELYQAAAKAIASAITLSDTETITIHALG